MSTTDWSPIDLELFSNICERISGYSDRLEPHLQNLLDKHQKLGGKLDDLARRLKKTSTRYHDPDLEIHLHKADRELQTQRPTSSEPKAGLASRIPGRRRNYDHELTAKTIKQLHFEVDVHIDIAEKSRTEFLFNHAYPKLQYVLGELLQQVQRGPGTPSMMDTNLFNPSARESTPNSTQSSSLALLPIDNLDVKILARAPVAIKIARIVWNSRADTLDHDQRRSRRKGFSRTDAAIRHKDEHLLAKEKFLNDVLSLIEETQLDELQVSAGGPSRDILDRLAGIVSQAAELNETLSSPEIGALQSSTGLSPRLTRRGDTLPPPLTSPAKINGRIPIPTPPDTRSSSNSPRAVGQLRKIPRKPLPRPSNPISPPSSVAMALVHEPVELSGVGRSWVELGCPEPSSSSEFPGIGSPAMCGSDSGSLIARSVDGQPPFPPLSAVAIGKLPATTESALREKSRSPSSWTKISSLEAGIKPSFCTLELASFNGKVFLLAVVTSNFVPAPSAQGSSQRALLDSPSTSHIGHSGSSQPFSNARTIEHLILPDTRPMPSVMYPDHEGPDYRPDTPYTITFTEKQSLCEYTRNPRPQLVGDLSYIFSDSAERDHIRSILFGKRLLLHAGVKKIEFDYIACLLGAVTLWEEDETSKPLTITFNRNSNASRSRPHGEVEYEIIALVSHGNHVKAHEPLMLKVRQVSGPGIRGSPSKKKDCRLFFSRSDEKEAFVSLVTPPQLKPG